MRNFLLGYLFGAASLYGALYFHVVRANDGFHFIPKTSVTLRDTYADIRAWDASAWTEHGSLAEAIAKANHSELLSSAAGNTFSRTLDNLLPHRTRSDR